MTPSTDLLQTHLDAHASALAAFQAQPGRLARWGQRLAWTLGHGGRLLTAGNGGSAAQAQHLATELVGKLDADRRALSAIALSADTSALTAIGNDYGYDEVFARQVRAHARPDDVVLLLSTSGRSRNVLAAADAARALGVLTWAMTGPAPNPLAGRCHDVLAVPAGSAQVVQELHLLALHVLCGYVDANLPEALRRQQGAGHPDGDLAALADGHGGFADWPAPLPDVRDAVLGGRDSHANGHGGHANRHDGHANRHDGHANGHRGTHTDGHRGTHTDGHRRHDRPPAELGPYRPVGRTAPGGGRPDQPAARRQGDRS